MSDQTPQRIIDALKAQAQALRAICLFKKPVTGVSEDVRLFVLQRAQQEFDMNNDIVQRYLKND